jgi:hypothetical protein
MPKILVATTVYLSVVLSTALAQTSAGKVLGNVSDSSGAAIAGATLTIRNVGTGAQRVATVSPQGHYQLDSVQVGAYELTIEQPGFKKYIVPSVIVTVNEETRVDAVLQVGDVSSSVTVSDTVSNTVQTTSATLGKVVEERQIVALPLNGRNFADLGLLQTGVTTFTPGTTNNNAYVVNGQRDDTNYFQLDGVSDVNMEGSTLLAKPNIDSVTEFKIQTSNYSAEFGRSAGSIVNVVTKSGTNDYHGTLWEFLRNNDLQARNFFLTPAQMKPPLKQNQFGVALGGPLTIPKIYNAKNKTFFFFSYEGFREIRGLTQGATVATAQERMGTFGFLKQQIVSPSGAPFAHNQIPISMFSPAAVNLLSLVPLPNVAGAAPRSVNYVSAPSTTINYDQFPFRVDQYLGPRAQLFYSGLLEHDYTYNPFQSAGDAHYPGFPNVSHVTNSHGAFGVTSVISSTAVNEFRAGFARTVSQSLNLPYLNPLDYGINFIRPQDAIGGLGLPDITITAMSGGGIGNQIQGPNISAITEYTLSDIFSKEFGRNHLKAGAEYRWGLEVPNNGFFVNGNFTFNGTISGDAFADYMLGQASQFTYGAGRTLMYMANKNIGAFIQDDIKITKNLTFNVGLRWDYYSPQIDKDGQASTFLVQNSGQTPGSGTGFVAIAGTNGLPKNGTYFPDYKDFQPRLGLAWDVFGNGKLAVRAGAGMFYQQLKNNLTLQQILSYPFHTQPIIQNTSLDNPIKPVSGTPIIGQLYVTDPHIKTPYTEAYNFSVQYQLMPNTVLEAAYVGNQSHNLLQFFELNQPYFIPGNNPNGTPISTEANKDSRRPFQGFSSILDSNSYGRSNYNSMQVSVNRQFSRNLSFLVGWTYSHSLDLSSIFHKGATNRTYLPTAQDSYDLRAEYGPSSFDVRHRLVVNQVYDLPFGSNQKWALNNRLLNGMISSWTLTTIWTVQGGYPFTVYEGNDPCQTSGGYTPSCRPNIVGDPNQGPKTPQSWFNKTAFAITAPGQFGNAGRNIVLGPGLFDTDFSLIRHRLIPLPERFDVEFRAEIFNVFNHTNLGTPVTDLSSGNFGAISSTAVNPRELQLGLKFRF